ncbi:MAG: hypothetical protein DSY58_08405, partial [Desulfobulbus sp.]
KIYAGAPGWGAEQLQTTVMPKLWCYLNSYIIFILMLMFSVDLYQNWVERKREQAPINLRRAKNIILDDE